MNKIMTLTPLQQKALSLTRYGQAKVDLLLATKRAERRRSLEIATKLRHCDECGQLTIKPKKIAS